MLTGPGLRAGWWRRTELDDLGESTGPENSDGLRPGAAAPTRNPSNRPVVTMEDTSYLVLA
jgi:hypothetical protein